MTFAPFGERPAKSHLSEMPSMEPRQAKGAAPDMEIRICGVGDAKKAVFKNPGVWNVLSISSPGHDYFDELAQQACADFQKLCFDDVRSNRDQEGKGKVPTEADVRKAIEFAANKSMILVHCLAGISRSSAIAFIVACAKGLDPFEAAERILDPATHAPNPLIVRLGAEILGDPRISNAYENFENVANMFHQQRDALGSNDGWKENRLV